MRNDFFWFFSPCTDISHKSDSDMIQKVKMMRKNHIGLMQMWFFVACRVISIVHKLSVKMMRRSGGCVETGWTVGQNRNEIHMCGSYGTRCSPGDFFCFHAVARHRKVSSIYGLRRNGQVWDSVWEKETNFFFFFCIKGVFGYVFIWKCWVDRQTRNVTHTVAVAVWIWYDSSSW